MNRIMVKDVVLIHDSTTYSLQQEPTSVHNRDVERTFRWGRCHGNQIAIRSISSSVNVSFVRSYSFVVRGDSWAAIA